jgi:ComF family protein
LCAALGALGLVRSAGYYEGSLRLIIHAFKYQRRRALARRLARLMRESGVEALSGADALVPVPLSQRRSFARGFNQADDLASCLGLPVWRVLRRARHGPPQAGLGAASRHANVQGAYARRTWQIRAPLSLQGRVVVLVDDVMTTGATLEACATVLADAGVRSVRGLTIARAVRAQPLPPRSGPHPSAARRR